MNLIRPNIHRMPDLSFLDEVSLQTWIMVFYVLFFIIVSAVVAIFLAHILSVKIKCDKENTVKIFVPISILISIALILRFGLSPETIKGFCFAMILLFASVSDIQTRHCDDYLHFMVILTALIGLNFSELPIRIFSAAAIFIVVLSASLFTEKSIGGADIKMATVSAFLLGLQKGLLGLILGLILALGINIIKSRKRNVGFPMIPYLAAGFMVAYFY